MLKMLNEGFDKKYKDNIVSKKSRKKIVEAVERPEEFAEFDDDMNPANYGIEEDLFDVLDDTAKGISDNINTITGKDSVLRDKNLGKNITDIGDAVAEIKTGGMFKEGIEDNLGVFHNDNGNDYKVIERSKSGHNALLQRGNQWIIAWNCPESNEGSWGQGHYFFDEETARKAWEEKYLNESAVANARTWLVDKEGKTPKEAEEIINNSSPEEIEKIALNYVKKNKEESLKEDAISDQHKFVYGALNLSDDKIKEIEKMFDTDYSSLSAEEQKYLVDKYDNLSQVNALLRFIQNGYKDAFSDGNDLAWKRFYNSVKRKVDEINKHNEEQIDVDAIIDYALEQRFDESLKESIKRIISSLNEAQMSPEDEADSKLLRGIYDKTQQRANAALTAEEKAVLNKYGLARSTWDKNIDVFFGDNNYTKPLVNKNERPGNSRSRYNRDSNKINYADRARKIKERGAGYARSLPYNPFNGISSDDHREWQDPQTGKWVRLNDKGLLDKERAAQNTTMTDKVVSMRQSLADRKYHGKKVADNDDEYNVRRAQLEKEYQKKLADLEHERQFSGKYHQDRLDRANKDIDTLLGREQKEESLDCKEESCDKMKKAVAEDFDERNLERVGTAEYQANTKRQEHIDMYRKFANLLPDEEITGDNIDEWALTRTACLANREPARIKAEILGQRYSDYELR